MLLSCFVGAGGVAGGLRTAIVKLVDAYDFAAPFLGLIDAGVARAS